MDNKAGERSASGGNGGVGARETRSTGGKNVPAPAGMASERAWCEAQTMPTATITKNAVARAHAIKIGVPVTVLLDLVHTMIEHAELRVAIATQPNAPAKTAGKTAMQVAMRRINELASNAAHAQEQVVTGDNSLEYVAAMLGRIATFEERDAEAIGVVARKWFRTGVGRTIVGGVIEKPVTGKEQYVAALASTFEATAQVMQEMGADALQQSHRMVDEAAEREARMLAIEQGVCGGGGDDRAVVDGPTGLEHEDDDRAEML
jgi:hypothetical protein